MYNNSNHAPRGFSLREHGRVALYCTREDDYGSELEKNTVRGKYLVKNNLVVVRCLWM